MPKTTDPIDRAVDALKRFPGYPMCGRIGGACGEDDASGTGTDFAVDLSGPRQLSDALGSHDTAKFHPEGQ
jgi:hypothetical protein